MTLNQIWKLYFPHLSPKEAYEKIAQMPYYGEFIGE